MAEVEAKKRLRKTASNSERKGAYYTPSQLVELVLDEALDPLIAEAETEEALLALAVADPACGAGAFPVGAQRRIATALTVVRHGSPDVDPWLHLKALRDAARCIYAVDLNPLAVELCKITVTLEGFHWRVPNPFLDDHFRVGNALLGTTPELIADGVPDAAFTVLTGDDPKVTAALKKRNKQERLAWQSRERGAEQSSLFDTAPPKPTTAPTILCRAPQAENYFAPFGTQLLDPEELKAAVAREIETADPGPLVARVAHVRGLVEWSNATIKRIGAIDTETEDAAETRAELAAEFDRAGRLLNADPLRHFDSMMFADNKEAPAAFALLAHVLACLATAPGGIAFAGLHWCVGSGHLATDDRTPCDAEIAAELEAA